MLLAWVSVSVESGFVASCWCVCVYASVFFAHAVVNVLNGAGARLYFSSPGIKLKPVRKKVHSENKK